MATHKQRKLAARQPSTTGDRQAMQRNATTAAAAVVAVVAAATTAAAVVAAATAAATAAAPAYKSGGCSSRGVHLTTGHMTTSSARTKLPMA